MRKLLLVLFGVLVWVLNVYAVASMSGNVTPQGGVGTESIISGTATTGADFALIPMANLAVPSRPNYDYKIYVSEKGVSVEISSGSGKGKGSVS